MRMGLKAAMTAAGVYLVACAPLSAQQMASSTELKPNPTVAMRDFEPPANADYELGRGDQISIDFGGRPEMNSKQTIGPDGRITLPLAGSILIADKTREQAAQTVVASLEPYYSHLSVTVGVDKYTSNQVILLGAVEHPGAMSFDRQPTLLEVISRGGVMGGGRMSNINQTGTYNVGASVSPISAGIPERCAIYRGSDQVLWVDLKQMLDSGNTMADLRLKRDDIVYVPSGAERYVSMLGQVMHPGALQLDDSMTLAKLLSLVGGLTPEAGGNPQIQVISPSTGKTRVIAFQQILSPGKMDLTLHSGDVIFVPKSGFNKAAYVIEKISPLVTMFTAAALFQH